MFGFKVFNKEIRRVEQCMKASNITKTKQNINKVIRKLKAVLILMGIKKNKRKKVKSHFLIQFAKVKILL